MDGIWRLHTSSCSRSMSHLCFQDLADLTSQPIQQPPNADFLDAACRVFLDAFDESSLFTWCRHFNYWEATETPIGNLCNFISLRIRDTWDIHIPGTDLELCGYDLWGDTVQLDKDETIAKTLDAWRPRWREFKSQAIRPLPSPGAPGAHSPCIFRVTALFLVSFCPNVISTSCEKKRRLCPCRVGLQLCRP